MMEPKGIVGACERARDRWVSLADQTPEVGLEVLVYTEDGDYHIDFYDGIAFGVNNVTHWMHKPKPPK